MDTVISALLLQCVPLNAVNNVTLIQTVEEMLIIVVHVLITFALLLNVVVIVDLEMIILALIPHVLIVIQMPTLQILALPEILVVEAVT